MLKGGRAAVQRDWHVEEEWASMDCIRCNKVVGEGEGVLYVTLGRLVQPLW